MRAMVLDAAGSPLRRADLPRQTLPDDPPTGYPPVRAAADPYLSTDLPAPPDGTATACAV
jgi:hypothetical protein